MGVKDLFKKNKLSKQELYEWQKILNPKMKKLYFSENQLIEMSKVQALMAVEIVNDSISVMSSTIKMDVFFSRYNLFIEKIELLLNLDNYTSLGISFGDIDLNEYYELIKVEKVKIINDLIKKIINDANNLKTEQGREKRLNKVKEEIATYESSMDPENIEYFNLEYVNCNQSNSLQKNANELDEANKTIEESIKDTTNFVFDKLDDDIPFGWHYKNNHYIKQRSSEIIELAISIKKETPIDEKAVNLKQMIDLFYKFKQECYSKDECFIKYFQLNWEHCRNSRSNDFCYISKYEEELNYLLENYSQLKDLECRRNTHLPSLEKKILDFISKNEGILQTDLYKNFDDSIKSDISEKLYFLSKSSRIKRVKHGNSYELYNI